MAVAVVPRPPVRIPDPPVSGIAERQRRDRGAVIDWRTPIDDSALHLPAEHLPLYGTPVWEAMSEPDRCCYSRHECASLFSTVVWLENILMTVLVRHLYTLAPDHRTHRWLLTEVADECRHSVMFSDYVRRAGTPAYRPSARLRAEGDLFLRTQALTSAFIAVLAAEELIDQSNRATMCAADVHPLPRRIAQIHVAEETRHRSFAKTLIREQWPVLSARHKATTAASAPFIVFTIAESVLNPAVYRALRIPGGYITAATNPRYWQRVARDLRPFTSLLAEVGVINALTRPAWRALGLIDAHPAEPAAEPAPAPPT